MSYVQYVDVDVRDLRITLEKGGVVKVGAGTGAEWLVEKDRGRSFIYVQGLPSSCLGKWKGRDYHPLCTIAGCANLLQWALRHGQHRLWVDREV